MPWERLQPYHESHLRESIARGRVILFTGAGFSLAAQSMSGRTLPTTSKLAAELWKLLYQGTPDTSSLGDLYSVAVRRRPKEVRAILQKRLKVNPTTLPELYRLWFSTPWARIYTLNIDDLDEAASTAFALPRRLTAISALSSEPTSTHGLESVHLNGRLADFPAITFSEEQYGDRTARGDAWYHRLITDLLAKPVVFVGSALNEPTLWHYVALLGEKGAHTKEYRPRSYIVTKHLPLARVAKLEQYNVVWVQASQEEFANEFLRTCTQESMAALRK